jgi:hypothetical protein
MEATTVEASVTTQATCAEGASGGRRGTFSDQSGRRRPWGQGTLRDSVHGGAELLGACRLLRPLQQGSGSTSAGLRPSRRFTVTDALRIGDRVGPGGYGSGWWERCWHLIRALDRLASGRMGEDWRADRIGSDRRSAARILLLWLGCAAGSL